MNVRVDIWQLVEEDLFTDAPSWSTPIAWGQNTTEWVQGDGSLATPIKLDINWLVADPTPDDATDYVAIYDTSTWDHKKILLNQLTSTHTVPIWPTTSIVTPNWDNAIAQVGDASKPFSTIQAAVTATPFLWYVYVLNWDFTENITWASLKSIILRNSILTWNINWNIQYLSWDKTQDTFTRGASSWFVRSKYTWTLQGTITSVKNLSVFAWDAEWTIPANGSSLYISNVDIVQPVTWTLKSPTASQLIVTLHDIGRIISTGILVSWNPVSPWQTKIHEFKRIWNCSVAGLISSLDSDTIIDIEQCNIVSSANVFGGLAVSQLNLKNNTIATTWGWTLMSFNAVWWAAWAAKVTSYNNILTISAPESIDRPTWTINWLTLKSSCLMSKPYDTSWVVNQVVNNDVIAANL